MNAVLLVGTGSPGAEAVVQKLGAAVSVAHSREQALSSLLSRKPSALFLSAGWHQDNGISGLIEAIRGDWRLHDVPILAAIGAPPAEVEDAFRRGCDDVVVHGSEEFAAKLGAILAAHSQPKTAREHPLLFVGSGRLHRVLFSKLLQGAGYHVTTAETELEARATVEQKPIALALLDLSAIDGDPRALASLLLSRGAQVIALTRGGQRHPGEPFTHTFDKLSPPEDLLFLLNELLSVEVAQKRQSVRRLWPVPARFGAGAFGMVYNLSQTGLFIRTLAPPPMKSSVEIEVYAPGISLRAVGQVVWCKSFAPRSAQDYPPGFGLTFTQQGEGWASAYASLAEPQ